MPPTGVATTPPTIDPECPSTRRHGTFDAYNTDGCRCPAARAAHTRWAKAYKLEGQRRTVPSVGTARRLQALACIGYSRADVAGRLGVSVKRVEDLVGRKWPSVRRRTAMQVAGLYDQLVDTSGPSRIAASKAQAAGWAPPIAWDETTIDDPAAEPYGWEGYGDPDPAVLLRIWAWQRPEVVGKVEQAAFVREAHARGVSDPEIGEYLGWDAEAAAALARQGKDVTPKAVRSKVGRRVQKFRSRRGIGGDLVEATDEAA
jgi:hypothetical protein